MAVPRSEYLSNVWKDGIFGSIPVSFLIIHRLILNFQITRSSSAPVERVQFAVRRSGLWFI
jgi:hypothetical protein